MELIMESNRIKLETDWKCELNNNQTNRFEFEDNSNILNKTNFLFPTKDDSVDADAKEILERRQNYEKMETEEKICRFCFKRCCNFKTINDDIKDISDVLLPGIDLSAIQEPMMCTHCEEMLFMFFDFKTRCLCTHDYLIPFVNKKDVGVKLNLKDIYMTKHKNSISTLEDQNICGFCMCPVKNGSAIYFDVGERHDMLRKTMEQCLPELNLSIIEEPVICVPCHASLENHSRFVANVLIGEEKITKYKESLDVSTKCQIDLRSLGQFLLSDVDGCGGDVIKLEKMSSDDIDSVDKEVEQKCNAMDIDELKFNNEQKFPPTNMLDCKIESNDIDAIKIEESICAEEGIEFKEENIVEMQDQKVLFDEEIEIKTDELDFNSFEDGIVMAQLNARLNEKRDCSILPNFGDNLLKPHIKETPINKNTILKFDSCSFQTEQKISNHNHPLELAMYKCDSCAYQTKRKRNLKVHFLRHKDISEVTMYKCDLCLYQTKYKSKLKSHLLIHNPSELALHKCDSCAYQTIHRSNLKAHLLRHKDISEVTMYKCDLCLYQTKYKSKLKRHLPIHKNPSARTMHKCDSCAYQTILKSNLKAHLLRHKAISEVTMYKCDLCLYQSKYKSSLKSHSVIHKNPSEVTMHKCDSCAYQTRHKSALRSHLLKHNNPEVTVHKCDSCAFQSIHRKTFKSHLLTHKNPPEVTVHKCNSCAYETIHRSALKSHLLKHKDPSEVTMQKCDSCAFQTIRKCDLKSHSLKHKDISEVTMYKCASCLFQTKYKSKLKRHLLIHKSPSERTVHKCGTCSFQTIHRYNLKKHLLKHKDVSEVTMYKCDSCLYQTRYKSKLKIHSLKHKTPSEVITQEVKHKCDSCAYQTRRKSDLRSHLLKHKDISEVTMYKCDSCLYQTKYMITLKRHLLRHNKQV